MWLEIPEEEQKLQIIFNGFGRGGWINGGSGAARMETREQQLYNEDVVNATVEEGTKTRTGTTTHVVEEFEEIDAGDKVLHMDSNHYR